MDNLTYLIHKTIERDSVVRLGIGRGLISARSLAAYILKKNPDQKISQEALRTAIRRMESEFEGMTTYKDHVNKYIKDSKLHIKSGIVKVAFQKGDASLELLNRGLKAMEIYGGDTFRVTKGQKILHILVDEQNLKKIKEVYYERILNIEENVCEITIILTDEAYTQYGMWAAFINEIAINKISLVDAFSCGTEISIFVKQEDCQRTYNVLQDMIETARQDEKLKDSKLL